MAHVATLDKAALAVELLAHGDARLLLKYEERQEALIQSVRALEVARLRGGVHREQDLGEGESGHEPLGALLHIEAAVERAEPGEDGAARRTGGRLGVRLPQLAQGGDARRRRQGLQLDALHRRHLVRDARDERRRHVNLR